jgi:DNA repair protein RAD50
MFQTIIESLRFATTGNCPPGTSGGKCFVYDPKLSGQGEVKGQVKLQFVNLKKQTMQITRTLQVSQKLEKLELKTVDPFIDVKTEDGEVSIFIWILKF